MVYVKSTELSVLNELTERLEDFPISGVVAILEDTLNHARSYVFPFALDLEVIANSWLSESEEYVLKSHKVEDLEELHDTIHYLQPDGPGTQVYYMYLDDDNGVVHLTED